MPNLANGLHQGYLQHALAGGAIVAILAAFVGYFVILRGAAFATHALSQVGFAGAAAAVFLGIEPIVGLIAFALLGALGLGVLSTRSRSSDVTTALVLVFALGTGALFLNLAHGYASNVFGLLFGTIVGVDSAQVGVTAIATVVALGALGAIARPLLFATVARDAARAAGVKVNSLDIAFLAIVALAAAVIVPIVGTLLVFSLTLGPAAAAAHLATRPATTIALAIALGLVAVVASVALAYETDWPVGFFIASIAFAEYVAARLLGGARNADGSHGLRQNPEAQR
jgi:zinc/manganese transport system permease protein